MKVLLENRYFCWIVYFLLNKHLREGKGEIKRVLKHDILAHTYIGECIIISNNNNHFNI